MRKCIFMVPIKLHNPADNLSVEVTATVVLDAPENEDEFDACFEDLHVSAKTAARVQIAPFCNNRTHIEIPDCLLLSEVRS